MDINNTIQMLKGNPGAVQSIMQSRDGMNLIAMLTAADGGAALNKAAQQAAAGDTAAITRLLQNALSTKEGADQSLTK